MKSKIQQRRNRRISRRRALRGGRPLEKAKQDKIQRAMDESSRLINSAISKMDPIFRNNDPGLIKAYLGDAKELLLSAKKTINAINYE
jgi:hypothetical protein